MRCLNCGKEINEDNIILTKWYKNGFCSEKCNKEYVKKNIEKYLEEAGIGKGLINIMKRCKLDKGKEQLINEFIEKDTWFFIRGEVGTGKTIFCCFLIKELVEQLEEPLFLPIPNLIFNAQKMRGFGEDYSSYIEDIINRKILILDDIGVEKGTEFTNNLLYLIINTRIEKGLKTLITSNFSLQQINEKLGSRIADRIERVSKIKKFTGGEK